METSAGRPFRRSTRLQNFDYRGVACFVTICSMERRCMFSDVSGDSTILRPVGEIIHEEGKRHPESDPA